ncbi:MAG: bifunctional phosphopantothenoylcysteine decarboxylase/phosphopantothenate--cysteine ligase CoaBC [Lactobacillus sp.]|nr:bifunctional phosphopantothenoylcysteine decarboxylase/phosphopantothenate--cysteine ligase CoaBC [Lactobacillus sp.]
MKKFVVMMSGGVAAYKTCYLLRRLKKAGHEVKVVMTENALKFVSKLQVASLIQDEAITDLFLSEKITHIKLAKWADCVIVAPATANVIAKFANGIADDAVSTTFLAMDCPKIVVPAMNDKMYQNPATQANLQKLREYGVKVMTPATGLLAEGYAAIGRMPEPDEIFDYVMESFDMPLRGKRFLITTGGTIAKLDPVRFIGNFSSGKMGISLAEAALELGAEVSLIAANINLPLPSRAKIIKVQTAKEMATAVFDEFYQCDCVIMAAAVSDYEPDQVRDQKIKKEAAENLMISLHPSVDILKELGHKKQHQLVVGFAAESENLIENAKAKLARKKADLIVANDISQDVFGSDENQVSIVSSDGVKSFKRMSKIAVARTLLKYLNTKYFD